MPFFARDTSAILRFVFAVIVLSSSLHLTAQVALLPRTAVPVRFDKTIDARKSKPGDRITATTLQGILLSNGRELPRGSRAIGHVVQAVALVPVSRDYTEQPPSLLAVHFDRLESGDLSIPVGLVLRAIADSFIAEDASRVEYDFEEDSRGVMHLIGGVSFDPFNEAIRDVDNRIIAYNRLHGVYAHLLAAHGPQPPSLACSATETEQSIALFSPDACGVYGFDRFYLAANGTDGSETFVLASHTHTAFISAGSAALLQQNISPPTSGAAVRSSFN